MIELKNEVPVYTADTTEIPNKARLEKFDLIKKANDLIKTIQLKQKDYAPVNERVLAFRRVEPNGRIITEPSYTENYVSFEASVYGDDGRLLATGHAREYLKTEFAIEKAETSAIGRALGLCGYGITTSIASFEDMENLDVKKEEIFDEPTPEELVATLLPMMSKQEQIDLLNCVHKVTLTNVPTYILTALIRYKEDEKHHSAK